MKLLFVLGCVFIICLLAGRLFGRIAMSIMLLFTATRHFVFTKGMALMIPAFIPFKRQLVYFTGLVEICAAIGLLIARLQEITAWLLILFFIHILPANINAALRQINYQRGTYEGPGAKYLWFRVPLQVLLIAWVSWCALRWPRN